MPLMERSTNKGKFCWAPRFTPTHSAALWVQPRELEVLCAVGVDLRARTHNGNSLIDCAFSNADEDDVVAMHAACQAGREACLIH